MTRERLYAALTPNGRLVHLAHANGRPVCGSRVVATCRVHARVTCPECRRRRPKKTARLADRPLVVGVDWAPLYAAIRRALASGEATRMPHLNAPFWPVLHPKSK